MKKIKAPVWIFGVMDIICANALGVKPKVFAEKIERLSEKRMDVVINALLEGNHEFQKYLVGE